MKLTSGSKHPEIVQAMTKHYEKWHAEARKLFDQERWITIGDRQANPMMLYSQDWVGDYCDNPRGLFQSTARGYWNVIVDRAGVYEIELRRWPRELNQPINAFKGLGSGAPIAKFEKDAVQINPIKARMQIGDHDITKNIDPSQISVVFDLNLTEGPADLSTWFIDADGTGRSAYWVYVRNIK